MRQQGALAYGTRRPPTRAPFGAEKGSQRTWGRGVRGTSPPLPSRALRPSLFLRLPPSPPPSLPCPSPSPDSLAHPVSIPTPAHPHAHTIRRTQAFILTPPPTLPPAHVLAGVTGPLARTRSTAGTASMSRDRSSTHRRRSVAARLMRLAAAGLVMAVGAAAVWVQAAGHHCVHDRLQARVLQSVAQQHRPPGSVSALGLPYVSADPISSAHTVDWALADSTSPSVAHSADWGTLRILVSTADLTDPDCYCSYVGQLVNNHAGALDICKGEDILTDAKRHILVTYLLPLALQLHAERLEVRQVQGTWKVTGMEGDVCGTFKVPEEHVTVGFSNIDFVLYVASVPSDPGVMAWAVMCQAFPDDRPAVGVVNIPTAYIQSAYDQIMVRTVAHEVAHALGFDLTAFDALELIHEVNNLRERDYEVPVLNTPTVVAKAREQYGCTTLTFLELEDTGGSGFAGSHLKGRNAKDELMAPASDAGYYTNLTMAVFHDFGFYQADFTKAEVMPWAYLASCDFITKKCMENNITQWPEMFCNTTERRYRCPSDRLKIGTCSIATYDNPLPTYFRYFTKTSVGGRSSFLDYCPVIVGSSDGACNQDPSTASPSLKEFNVFSDASRCLDGAFTPKHSTGPPGPYNGLCANVKCDRAHHTYSVQVYGSSGYVACTPGQSIELATTSDAFVEGSYIMCPLYVEVCQANIKGVIDFEGDAADTAAV
ncbi:GP63, leishmanolysin [Leishmania braziliensis MHOM/BR/75/M2904]|uniref:Leishmanolysin n=1 Tax=Leishmania braziliensis TaxID=5660 RepID=A4H6E0_LEIBR|nr:GP63, leishmanolysin [Leishmania braziliensis MHOM/BR/75/M2904]CAM37365.2 GP63, leishmanolysin [Leishmania braziliensis MHOM/BR/75/M2904]